jgi:Clostripain family
VLGSNAHAVRRARNAAAAALAFGLALQVLPALTTPASGNQPSARTAPAAAEEGVADWTFMVYGVLDTSNVADVLSQDLASLTGIQDTANVNIVALVDLPEQHEAGYPTQPLPGLAPFTTAKLLVLDGGRWNEVRDLGEISMGRPDVLASFIDEVADRYPAEKYGITLMDHGGGRYGGYWDNGPPGTRNLTIPDMRNGLLSGLQLAGIDRFDVLFHASCLMSNYETVSALAPTAEAMAGSEEIMFANPLVASALIPLADGVTGDDMGRSLIEGYGTYLDELSKQPGAETLRDLAAMSVVNGEAVTTLDKALKSFSDVAVAHMDEITTEVARARAAALEFVVGIPGQEESWDLVDLGDFLRNLQDVPAEVAIARDAAFAALQGSVTHQLLGQATEQATGLNVYLPTNSAYVGDYFAPGTAPPGWAAFVRAFLESGAQDGPDGGGEVRFVSPTATVVQADATGIKINGQLQSGAAANVVDTATQVYARMGDQEGALALQLPAYLNAGGEGVVQGVWDYSLTVLTDGEKSIPATTGYQAQSGGLVGSFLAQYRSPAGDVSDVGLRLLLSSEGDIQSVTVVDVSNGGASANGVTLELGGSLTPYLFVPSSGSFTQKLSSQSIAVSNDLAVAFSKLPAGTPFEIGVLAGDVAGNYDGAFVQEQVR